MADLRLNNTRMLELIQHIQRREGSISRFYLDARNLVTIGIGHLVDSSRPVAVRLRVGRDFARKNFRFFRHARGGTRHVTSRDVFQDWQRVLGGGRAQLRITQNGISTLLRQRLGGFIGSLYRLRPYVLVLDERIHMALIDARFNPAGVRLYRNTGNIGRMWVALNCRRSGFNLRNGLKLFERAWHGRGGRLRRRYQQRHRLRVDMFRRGVESMEYELRKPTKATAAKRYPPYPAKIAGIIGLYRKQSDADAEKGADKAWKKATLWECWIKKNSRAIGTYIYGGAVVGVYKSGQDAILERVTPLKVRGVP